MHRRGPLRHRPEALRLRFGVLRRLPGGFGLQPRRASGIGQGQELVADPAIMLVRAQVEVYGVNRNPAPPRLQQRLPDGRGGSPANDRIAVVGAAQSQDPRVEPAGTPCAAVVHLPARPNVIRNPTGEECLRQPDQLAALLVTVGRHRREAGVGEDQARNLADAEDLLADRKQSRSKTQPARPVLRSKAPWPA